MHDCKLEIEVDEFGHSDRSIDIEIKRQKVIEEQFGCEFIRINLDEQNCDIFKTIKEIHRHIKNQLINL